MPGAGTSHQRLAGRRRAGADENRWMAPRGGRSNEALPTPVPQSRCPTRPKPRPRTTPPAIYIDADACPVKAEIYRVAERYGITTHVVSNALIALPRLPFVHRALVGDGFDAADDWIAERAGPDDIVVTSDIPLASRCLKRGAQVLAPNGKPFTAASIGMALAMRNLMQDLRAGGDQLGGPKPFTAKDRSAFLQALDAAVVRARRARAARPGKVPAA